MDEFLVDRNETILLCTTDDLLENDLGGNSTSFYGFNEEGSTTLNTEYGLFTWDPETGNIYFTANTTWEGGTGDASYAIQMGKGTISIGEWTFTININDAPEITGLTTNTFTEDSGVAVGATVATFSVIDDGLGGDVTVAMTTSDPTLYELVYDSTTGIGQVLLTQAGLELVNLGAPLPEFILVPSDESLTGSNYSATPIVIAVNDAPELTIDTTPLITEDSTAVAGAVVATYSTSDEENHSVSVAITQQYNYFTLVDGEVRLTQEGADQINLSGQIGTFTLTATDSPSELGFIAGSDSQTITPNITYVNDAPIINSLIVNNFEQGNSYTTESVVATFTTFDEEGDEVSVGLSDTIHYRLGEGEDFGKIFLTDVGLNKVNGGIDLPEFTLTPFDGFDYGLTKTADPVVTPAPTPSGANYDFNDLADFTWDRSQVEYGAQLYRVTSYKNLNTSGNFWVGEFDNYSLGGRNSGYVKMVEDSSDIDAFNGFASPFTVSSKAGAGDFDFISGQFSAAWNNNLQISLRAYDDGVQVGTAVLQADVGDNGLVNFIDQTFTGIDDATFTGRFDSIDRLEMSSYGGTNAGAGAYGTHFVTDNWTVEFETV